MNRFGRTHRQSSAFTILEMMVAMVASAFLLAGLGSIMFIARQIAYTPTAAARRAKSADVINQISDELRYATVITQQTSQILEFVVADRNNDGTAEKIRYEWSGAAGDPLRKTVNGGTAVDVLPSVYSFGVTLQQQAKVTTLTTTTDTAEAIVQTNTSAGALQNRDITATAFSSQVITPNFYLSVPTGATCWNATKVDFYASQQGTVSGQVLTVALRSTGDPLDGPTSNILGQTSIAKSSLTSSANWNTVTFPTPIRNLSFSRLYALTWTGSAALTARLSPVAAATGQMFDSEDSGASWQFNNAQQMYFRLYATYTTPGPSYNVTRTYVPCVRLALQAGNQTHSRIDASIPLRNSPELLANYWRTDFDRNPTTTNSNGDTTSDWAVTGGGAFDTSKLANGIWTATGAIETRPLSDFATTTTVEACCRNTSVGGNGAVVAVYVDRQSGLYAPLLVYLQKQSDGTQTLTLYGRTSDTVTKQLFTRSGLSSGFVRFRLTVLPANDVVNLQIKDEDQGTFTYPRYAPTSTSDRYLTLYSDTSSSEFDYVDVRSGIN
jgi:hypothetical protein